MSPLLIANPVEPAELADALGLHRPTPEQATVIAAPVEPSLVVAGAGAGKTETMAARVVWLVANGIVSPDRVLGLTFTRKAARQLGERVRARLRRLAGSGLLDRLDPSGGLRSTVVAGEPTVLTYHAYAGRLLSEHGLRLPVQPGVRLLSETSSWQLAHRVVSTWDNELDTDRVPPTVTADVLALAGELGEHLVSTEELADYTSWMCQVIENAPRAKGQRAALPQKLTEIMAAQHFRLALLPLVEAYHRRKRNEGALDFADQMSLAAQLASEYPSVVRGERERFGSVLLDEYQDTGHAQRVLLRALFGGVENPPMPVTAVGDPAQAIYGWRGASAANLPRFTTDFPRFDGERLVPARDFGLLTSFRNPPEILDLANAIAEPLRARGLGVERLRAREGAGPADIACALLPDVRAEREWVADALARRWYAVQEQTGKPPTAAVLVRRRADMAPIAAELRARGLPVEVVGLGGLLDEPEVADLVSTLRVLADPLSGSAAARLLTGARWRLAAADVAALWRRAGELSSPEKSDGPELVVERVEQAGLIDAIDEPGSPERYSEEGYKRIRRVGWELAALRRRLDQSLPELVADVERTLLLDVESLARPGSAGRAHLDAFAEVVTDYAETAPTATLLSFVDYLNTAAHAEDGLTPGEVEVVPDRVQVLTVHSAKGLEWEVVAVPHLVQDVFPGRRRSSSWLRTATSLPAALRGDAQDLPELRIADGYDRKEVQEGLELHEAGFVEREQSEERRLCYVALTRSEHALIVSGHWWNESSSRAKGPSEFLTEIAGVIRESGVGQLGDWAPEPGPDDENPLVSDSRKARWPIDPLADRRTGVQGGVDLVFEALSASSEEEASEEDDPDGWLTDTDVLLEEWARKDDQIKRVPLPSRLSVSQLVALAEDSAQLATDLRRPLPMAPNSFARRGTEFHSWLERRFGGDQLIEIDDLPGAADFAEIPDPGLEELQTQFDKSEWAARVPHAVEITFSADVEGITLRGRMDAVFWNPDGYWEVVDWKTGSVPPKSRQAVLSVQLAAYRMAWAALKNVPVEQVRAAFHYVRANHTIRPADLLDAEGIRSLLRNLPES